MLDNRLGACWGPRVEWCDFHTTLVFPSHSRRGYLNTKENNLDTSICWSQVSTTRDSVFEFFARRNKPAPLSSLYRTTTVCCAAKCLIRALREALLALHFATRSSLTLLARWLVHRPCLTHGITFLPSATLALELFTTPRDSLDAYISYTPHSPCASLPRCSRAPTPSARTLPRDPRRTAKKRSITLIR